MNNPKFSIITPSFNQGEFIEETILSIITQDYPNLEYIIVDGDSTDNTKDILKKYSRNSRVTKIISEKDKGQTDALIKGFNLCSGDILGWVNSDDMLTEGALSTVAQHFINHPEIDILVGKQIAIDEKDKQYGIQYRRCMTKQDWLERTQLIGQPCTFFKASAYRGVGGLNPRLEYCMDYELFIKFSKNNFKYYYIEDLLALFRFHTSSKTVAVPYKFWREEFQVFRNYGGNIITPFYYWKIRAMISWFIKRKILRLNKINFNKEDSAF